MVVDPVGAVVLQALTVVEDLHLSGGPAVICNLDVLGRNQTWQSDFTHYRLTRPDGTPGKDVEILTWLDDHSRYALHLSAHAPVTAHTVLTAFTQACDLHGRPASTLTDNGMVYTTRLAGRGRTGGRTALERHLAITGIEQKNSRPNHPTTCGKVERFQQTMKNWLRAQPNQPTTLTQLQHLLDAFATEYNQHRPHRALNRTTPAAAYNARPKATPPGTTNPHDRVRRDKIDPAGKVTLRIGGHLHKIGIGRTHARTPVLLLVHDLNVASSTPPPANSSANSPSTPPAPTNPNTPHKQNTRTHRTWVRVSGMS